MDRLTTLIDPCRSTCRRPVVLAPTLLPKSMPMARVNAQRKARKGPSDEKSVAGVGGRFRRQRRDAATCGPACRQRAARRRKRGRPA